jgi:hypothetical protein
VKNETEKKITTIDDQAGKDGNLWKKDGKDHRYQIILMFFPITLCSKRKKQKDR